MEPDMLGGNGESKDAPLLAKFVVAADLTARVTGHAEAAPARTIGAKYERF